MPFRGMTPEEHLQNVLSLNYTLPDTLSLEVRGLIDSMLQVFLLGRYRSWEVRSVTDSMLQVLPE